MDVSKATTFTGFTFGLLAVAITLSLADRATAQNAGFVDDPTTGIRYRRVVRNVQRPVVEQRVQKQERTFYRPETVTETKPELRRLYTPVTQIKWQPYVHGRWNPFRQPVVAYRQVPQTHWETRDEVVNRTTTQTRWVAEKRTVEVPHQIVRMETEQRVDLEPVSRGLPQPSVGSTVAARLRPIPSESRVASTAPVARVVSNTVGRRTSEPPLRSSVQGGMKTNVLIPRGGAGSRLEPFQSGIGIATVPSFSMHR